MKNAFKLIWITAIVTVIGFGMTACDNGTTPSAHTHEWGAWTVTTPATCTTKGVETRVCKLNASHKQTRDIAINSDAHVWGGWVQNKAPTETADGEETRTCTLNPEHKETRPIAAVNHTHDWGEWTTKTAATCTGKEVQERVCSVCRDTDTQSVREPLGHDWEWIVTTPGTYTATGMETKMCKHDPSHTDGTRPIPQIPFTAIADFAAWLSAQPANTATTPYTVIMNVSDLTGIDDILNNNSTQYVSIDLSGCTITSIPNEIFYQNNSLVSITLPDNITSIGSQAFFECYNLIEINVANTNTAYCSVDGVVYNKTQTALVAYPPGKTGDFIVPADITSIGRFAFEDNTGIVNLIILGNVTSIGDYAFGYCTSLVSVTILGNGLVSIGEFAFYNCNKLVEITIPNSVTDIGQTAFLQCSSLVSVTIPDNVTDIRQSTFAYCASLTNVTIPDSVINIGLQAFRSCTSLTDITIPASVTSIENNAFYGCSNLTSVTFEGLIPQANFNSYAFDYNLWTSYNANGPGTYTKSGYTWTKEP
ncbi:MAG: leucine-rich repeat domain-containing protein [Treponema sp.]|jgi:hypothetical protein|nr:leucine-rich repeat domain-containing protein [Treponema sp.]